MHKLNISMDTAGLTDSEVNTRLMGVIDELNVQVYHAYGSNDNHFRVQYPFSGAQVKTYGRDNTAIVAGGITLFGVGGRTTFPLMKTKDGVIKVSLDAELVSQYVMGSTDMKYGCPTCKTDLDYLGDMIDPRALDFITQAKVNLELNYDKLTVSVLYNKAIGTGGGTAPWTKSKQYPTGDYVSVDFSNKMKSESVGLRLDYKVNKKWSVYAGVSKTNTSISETISEGDLNGTATVDQQATVIYPDGTTGVQNITKTINVHETGAKQTNSDFLNYTQFNMGVQYHF